MQLKILQPGDGRRLNVMGDSQVVRLTGADTGGAFMLVEQANPPGAGIPLHVHDNEDELFEVLEGAVAFTAHGKTTEVAAGGTVFLPRGVPHAWTATGPGITRTHVMAFPAGMEHMFEELAAIPQGPAGMDEVFEVCRRYGIRFLAPVEPGADCLAGA